MQKYTKRVESLNSIPSYPLHMEIGCSGTCCFSPRPCVRGAINTRSCSRFWGHLGCARVHTSARPAEPSRAAVLFIRSEGRWGAKVCKHSGPRGLDKDRPRHWGDRAAMDTAKSAERAHSPALPPPRSLCPPSAQPGYLSAGIHLSTLSVPAARGARGPPGPGSSPRILHLSPRPVPAALARVQCPCSVLVVSCGRAHVLYARFAFAILQVRGLLETLASNPRRERGAGGAPCCRLGE